MLVKGTQTFLGKKIPIIEGGFGTSQRAVLASAVAEIHETRIDKVNELIRNNINRFTNTDLIDLKSKPFEGLQFKPFGFTRMQVSKTKNIYLLSERGYTKLVAMMDNKNEKKWEVMDKLINEYFIMRETINSLEQLKAMALLKALEGTTESERLEGLETYSNIKAAEKAKPLLEEIDHLKRFLNSEKFTKQELATKLDTNTTKMAKILKELKIYTKDCNVAQWFKNRCPNVTLTIVAKGEFTVNGVRKSKTGWQWTTEGAYEVIKYLLENGKVIETSNHLFKLA